MSGEVSGPFWSLCFKQEAETAGARSGARESEGERGTGGDQRRSRAQKSQLQRQGETVNWQALVNLANRDMGGERGLRDEQKQVMLRDTEREQGYVRKNMGNSPECQE